MMPSTRILAIALAGIVISTSAFGGDWNYQSEIDEITDAHITTAWTYNKSEELFDPTPQLIVRCEVSTKNIFPKWSDNPKFKFAFNVIVNFDEFIGSVTEDNNITYRFDKQEAETDSWLMGNNYKSLVATSALGSFAFAENLMTANQVTIRENDRNHTVKFSLAGSKAVIEKTMKGCRVALEQYLIDHPPR